MTIFLTIMRVVGCMLAVVAASFAFNNGDLAIGFLALSVWTAILVLKHEDE